MDGLWTFIYQVTSSFPRLSAAACLGWSYWTFNRTCEAGTHKISSLLVFDRLSTILINRIVKAVDTRRLRFSVLIVLALRAPEPKMYFSFSHMQLSIQRFAGILFTGIFFCEFVFFNGGPEFFEVCLNTGLAIYFPMIRTNCQIDICELRIVQGIN